MHELAHQARRDCLWNLLARAVCTAGCFQPLLWVLARRLEEAGEDAADDRVLAAGADVKAYARDLATAAERFLLRRPESVAGLGVIRFRSSLGRRVTHVLDTSRNWVSSLSWKANATICTLTALATVLTAALSCAGPATEAAAPAAPAVKPLMGTLTLPNATDADLAGLKDRKDLYALDLSNSKVTDAGLANLKEMQRLMSLGLSNTKVTDAGLEQLKDMPEMNWLVLNSTQVTDAGLEHLRRMLLLSGLGLSNTKVTGAGLANLKELKNLSFLDLSTPK